MLFSVPQYIDVEDKVVGPLTVKQFLWMLALGAILLVLWFSVPSKGVFFVIGIPIAIVFGALAFYRPYGQPLISFVVAGVVYLFGPKIYVWKRTPAKIKTVSQQKKDAVEVKKESSSYEERRQAALKNIGGIARMLDSRGNEVDGEIIDILKKPQQRR